MFGMAFRSSPLPHVHLISISPRSTSRPWVARPSRIPPRSTCADKWQGGGLRPPPVPLGLLGAIQVDRIGERVVGVRLGDRGSDRSDISDLTESGIHLGKFGEPCAHGVICSV